MKRRLCILSLLLLCCTTAFAKAEDTHIVANMPIPERYRPIFEFCGVENEEELFGKLAQHIAVHNPDHAEKFLERCKDKPIQIHYGGTTKELLADKKWTLAIVSSKDVDLHTLAAKKQINYVQSGNCWYPIIRSGYRHYLLPDELAEKLPKKDTPFIYDVHFYDYDAQTDDATLLIAKRQATSEEDRFMEIILDARPADMVRKVEGINHVKFWTVEELLERPEDWDTALLDLPVHSGQSSEELKRLDEAGLLCDLSQDAYLASRTDQTFKYCRMLPRGVFAEDGRMIALPCTTYYDYETDEEEHLLIVNAQSPYIEKALAYGELLAKTVDCYWGEGKEQTVEEGRRWYEEACSR